MKRAVLVLMAFFPLAVAAQEIGSTSAKNQSGVASSLQMNPSLSDDDSSAKPKTGTDLESQQDPKERQKPSGKPHKPSKPSLEPPGPKIPPSMVGYIDDATVESQFRTRFDAAFHNSAPDRAEFFYAQCSCIGSSAPGPNALVADLNFQQLYLYAEYAPVKRFSFFAEVPVRWIQPLSIPLPGEPQLTNEAGLSDVMAGVKLAALASYSHYLTFQIQGYFPTGDASKGLGTNHYSFEPALLYYQRISDRMAIEAQIGDSHPIGGSYCPNPPCNSGPPSTKPSQGFAGDVFFYGVGPSYTFYRAENVQIAPVVELVGWKVLGGFVTDNSSASVSIQQALGAEGTNTVNLKVGARTRVGVHSSFYLGYGHQLTHANWYKEVVRAEYRYSF